MKTTLRLGRNARKSLVAGILSVSTLAACGDVTSSIESPWSGESTYRSQTTTSDYILRFEVSKAGVATGEFFFFDEATGREVDIASGKLEGTFEGDVIALEADAYEPDEATRRLRGRFEEGALVLTSEDGAIREERFELVAEDPGLPAAGASRDLYTVEWSEPFVARGVLSASVVPVTLYPFVYPCSYRQSTVHPGWYRADDAPASAWTGTFGNGYVWIDVYEWVFGRHLARLWYRNFGSDGGSGFLIPELLPPGGSASILAEDSWVTGSAGGEVFSVSGTVSR